MAENVPWSDEGGPRRIQIASIGVTSAVRVTAGLYAAMGAVGGVMIFAMALSSPLGGSMVAYALAAPILYGGIGGVTGGLGALAYNLVASAFGGLELELE